MQVASQVGTLTIKAHPGYLHIQPDSELAAAWHQFARPLYHTRSVATGAAFSVAFWARLKAGQGTLEGAGNEVCGMRDGQCVPPAIASATRCLWHWASGTAVVACPTVHQRAGSFAALRGTGLS